MTGDDITFAQQRLGPTVIAPSSRRDLRCLARWWELEAMRGYPSSDKSREYAADMRWLVELMDNGVKVIGVRFDVLMKQQARPA